jgi:hypothetical protein
MVKIPNFIFFFLQKRFSVAEYYLTGNPLACCPYGPCSCPAGIPSCISQVIVMIGPVLGTPTIETYLSLNVEEECRCEEHQDLPC